MAKAKATNKTALQAFEEELRSRGLEYDLLEYTHAFVDVVFKDEQGVRQKSEFKPDGSELVRNEYGAEV